MSLSSVSNGSTAVFLDPSAEADFQPENFYQQRGKPANANAAGREQVRLYAPETQAGAQSGRVGGPSAKPMQPVDAVARRSQADVAPDTAVKSSAFRTDSPETLHGVVAGGSVSASADVKPQSTAAANAIVPNVTEITGLLKQYEPQVNNAGNIQMLEDLEKIVSRGTPEGAAQFESAQLGVSAKIADLPSQERGYYTGAQAGFIHYYETADTKEKRDAVATGFGEFAKTVDDVHKTFSSDQSLRAQNFFDRPYGAQFLSEKGQTSAGRLEQYRDTFNGATNEGERKKAFANAAALKSDLQQQIGNKISQSTSQAQIDAKKSDDIVLNALKSAESLHGSTDANSVEGFDRLETFGNTVFTNEANARAFKAMQQEHPEKFAELGKWANEASDKTAWAQKAIQSDPFKRQMTLPDTPKGYLNVDENKLSVAHYGEALLTEYQNASKDISNGRALYHAAQQPGPIKENFIREHTPPKPEWQQTAEEVFCRLTVGNLPIVGFAANEICPRSNMSDDARKGVDIAGAFLGAAAGAAGDAGRIVSDAAAEAAGKAAGKRGKFLTRSEAMNTAKSQSAPPAAASTNSSERAKTEGPASNNRSRGAETSSGQDADASHPVASASQPHRPGSLGDIPKNYVQPQPDVMWNSDRFPGLMEDRKGNTYAVEGKDVYAVKRDADNATWRVYNPQDPSRPAYPIRPNQDGGWEVHGNVGLKGGMMNADGGSMMNIDGAGAGPSGKQAKQAVADESYEQVANRWVADQDKQYKSIVKEYTPQQLNLHAYEHKQVKVSSKVFKTLTDAQKINEQINTLMPYGAGNQHWDIQSSNGESYKRVQVRRNPPEVMKESAGDCAGAGNCGEIAMTTAKAAGAKFKGDPVLQVEEDGIDHTYVLVGDPRDPKYGKSTVVVDPWPAFPAAHTLETGVERPYMPSAQPSRHEPFDPSKSPLWESDQVDAAYSEMFGTPADKDSVLLEIYTDDGEEGEEKWIWTQRTSGNDPSTRYVSSADPMGIVLDKIPDYIVQRYDPYIKRNDNHNGRLYPSS